MTISTNTAKNPHPENAAETFKGLSVRAEYGLYRFSDSDLEEETEMEKAEEKPEHGTTQTKRIRRQKEPTKHIAQGLYW